MAAQNNLAEFKTATTMSSREIAELVGSTHDSVLKTVRRLTGEGIVSGNDTPYTHPQNGQEYSEILLSFRDTMVVASGYSAEMRARIIDRWQQLEQRAAPTQSLVAPEVRVLSTQLELARLFEVPLHMAQVEAVKVVKLQTGADLSPWLKLAPAQSNLTEEDVFLEPNDLAKRLGVASGVKLNRMLLDAGLQYGGAGNWKPTASSKGHTAVHQWSVGVKSGVNLKWRASFVESQLALTAA